MAAGRPISVLVVDDEEEVALVAEAMLRARGFDAYRVGSAPEALAALEEHPEIDVLFTDVVMPVIDGIILADMSMQRFPRLKVVYATGFMDVARSLPGVVHGETLQKPYRLDQLHDAISRAIAAPSRPR